MSGPLVQVVEDLVGAISAGSLLGNVGGRITEMQPTHVRADSFAGVDKTGVAATDWTEPLAALPSGGGILFVPEGAYKTTTAFILGSGVTLQGESRDGAIIRANTIDAAIKTANPAVAVNKPTVEGLTLVNVGSTPTGIDARGMTRASFDNLFISGFAAHGVRFGASGYATGWTNWMTRSHVQLSPTCVLIEANGNWVTLLTNIIIPTNAEGSIGVDVAGGDSFRAIDSDIGYAAKATAIRLRATSAYALLLGNRHEAVASDAVVVAHPIEIEDGSVFNQILGDNYSVECRQPWVNDANPVGNRTTWRPLRSSYNGAGALGSSAISHLAANGYHDEAQDLVRRRAIYFHEASGSNMFEAWLDGDANRRFGMSVNGYFNWVNPATGSFIASLGPRSFTTGVLDITNGGSIAVSNYAALPGASATYRNVIATVQGGVGVADALYVCRKKADDTYEWRAI